MKENASDYNKEELFNKEIFPLLKKITNMCCDNNLPFISAFALKNDHKKQKTIYYKDANAPRPLDIKLYNDFVTDCMLVLNGLKVVAPFKQSTDFDDDAIDYIKEMDTSLNDSDEDQFDTGLAAAITNTDDNNKPKNGKVKSDNKNAVIIKDDSAFIYHSNDEFAIEIIGII